MSAVCAAYSNSDAPLSPAVRDRLRHQAGADAFHEFESADGRLLVIVMSPDMTDVGTTSRSGDRSRYTVVIGDPVFESAPRDLDATADEIDSALWNADEQRLGTLRGTFAGISYRADRGLGFVSDALGVQQLYYGQIGNLVLLSTYLRFFSEEFANELPFDSRGLIEKSCFGFCLGERSEFKGVARVAGGMAARFVENGLDIKPHFSLSGFRGGIVRESVTVDELAEGLTEVFLSAVRLRLSGYPREVSFLSGGMDSRLIVAALRREGVSVSTLNCSPPRSADEALGAAASLALGTQHFALNAVGAVEPVERMVELYTRWQVVHPEESAEASARRIWSGDGGSVGIGHVYLTDHIVETARTRGLAAASEEFCAYNRLRLLGRMLRASEVPAELLSAPALVNACMRSDPEIDPARSLYFFLLENDQRRHLDKLYERGRAHTLSYALPFFDRRVIEFIATSPVDPFLHHRLYNRWLARISPEAASVPWQAYPNHEPSLVPMPQNLGYQWAGAYSLDSEQNRVHCDALMTNALRILRHPRFPNHVFNKKYLWAAYALHRAKLRNVAYYLDSMNATLANVLR